MTPEPTNAELVAKVRELAIQREASTNEDDRIIADCRLRTLAPILADRLEAAEHNEPRILPQVTATAINIKPEPASETIKLLYAYLSLSEKGDEQNRGVFEGENVSAVEIEEAWDKLQDSINADKEKRERLEQSERVWRANYGKNLEEQKKFIDSIPDRARRAVEEAAPYIKARRWHDAVAAIIARTFKAPSTNDPIR